MKIADFFNRKLIEEFTIKPEVKAMSKHERLNLLDRLFKEEYQGKVVSFKMLEEELFVKTSKVTREHFGIFQKGGSFKGFVTKLNIGASGDYVPLISNCEYVRSSNEKKPKQNSFHRNTLCWHYFAKEILCEGEKFSVQIDVRESKQHECIVYNVGMRPVGKTRTLENEQNKKRRGPTNSVPTATDVGGFVAPVDISSKCIIPQETPSVKRENRKSLISLIADAMSRSKKADTPNVNDKHTYKENER